MFGLFARTRPRLRRPSRTRLAIESLEERNLPSITIATFAAAPTNVGMQVQLSGTITGDQVSGDFVSFSGKATGEVTTDANGHFSFSTTASGLGTIYANAETP